VRVLTRSPLVTRDIDLFQRFSDITVGLGIPTLDDDARTIVEPTAPPIEGRLEAVRELADAGLEPFVNLAPAYPITDQITPDEIAQRIADAGAARVFVGRWHYLDDVIDVLVDRVTDTEIEPIRRAVADDAYYDRLFTQLRGAFRRAGVDFTTM